MNLFEAASTGDAAAVSGLLRDTPAVEGRDEEGFTPLMLASWHGHQEAALVLLQAGADPNATTANGTTPLLLAVHAGHGSCARLLLEHGAEHSWVTPSGQSALHEAVARGEQDITKLILQAGADPNILNGQGRAPLHEASRLDMTRVVMMLIKSGADISIQSTDRLHWTPLQFAKQAGHGRVAAELRRNGATLEVAGCVVRTPGWRLRLGHAIKRQLFIRSELRLVRGVPIRVLPHASRESLFTLLRDAVDVIWEYGWESIRRQLKSGFSIWVPGWLNTDAAYDRVLNACLFSSRYLLAATMRPVEVAGVTIHEMTHGRTWTQAYFVDDYARARTERLCYEVQADFLARIPGAGGLAAEVSQRSRWDPLALTMSR